jgi:hypothetical protein
LLFDDDDNDNNSPIPGTPPTTIATPTSRPPAAVSPSPSSSSSINNSNLTSDSLDDQPQQQELQQCNAIAASTRVRCRKFASLPGQTYCASHGGAQLRPKVVMPPCQAISQRSRQPCKNSASDGSSFCSHHGGQAKSIRRILVQQQGPMPQVRQPTTTLHRMATVRSATQALDSSSASAMDVNVTSLQTKCLQFLVEGHPKSKCPCTTDAPCTGLALAKWAQLVISLAQNAPGSSIFAVSQTRLASLAPHSHNDLFADLFEAVNLFGSDVFFLPQLYQHMQRSFQQHKGDALLAPNSAEEAATKRQKEGNSNNQQGL